MKEGEKILQYTNGTYLVAPYDLVISNISIPNTQGQCTNEHLIKVQAVNPLSMNINVDESELSKIQIGQEVEIIPTINSQQSYSGSITQINQEGTYSTKGTTYQVTVIFENDGFLKIGMSAKANIILEKAENVLVVPKEAIETNNQHKQVIIMKENNETETVTVETGISNDAYTEIKSGLEENQTIQITKETTTNIQTQMNRNQQGSNEEMTPKGERQERLMNKNY